MHHERPRPDHARDPRQRAALGDRRELRRADAQRLLDQHQGAPRPLDHDHGRPGQADRAGPAVAADPSRLDVGADGGAAREVPDAGDPRGRSVRRQRPVRRGRHASARRQPGDAGVRRGAAGGVRLQHRASRRHRRHGARQHGGRDVGDLPGGAAHPGAQAVPPGRAAAGPARPDAAQRARARGAARRLLRPDRRRAARRPAARGGHRGPWARRGRGGLRGAARAHRGAHAGGDPGDPGRPLPVRRRDGRRRPRCPRHPDRRRGRRRGRAHPLRLRRHGAAGAGQHQRHAQRDDRRGRLRAQGAGRPRGAEQPGHARRARGRQPSLARWSTRCSRRRSRRARIPASGSSTWCSARSPRRCPSARSRPPTAPTRWRCSPASIERTRPAVRLPRDARRRHGRATDEGRQGRRAGRHHQHLEPAGRGDRARVSLAGRGVQPDPGLPAAPAPIAAGSACAAWCGRSARASCSTASASVSATSPGGCSAARPAGRGSS